MRNLILFFLVCICSKYSFANGSGVFFGSPSYVSVSTSSQLAVPQNTLRSYLLLVNTGSNIVYANFGTPNQTTTSGIPIPAGGNYEPLKAPQNSIYLISPTGSSVTVLQGQ